MISTESKTNQQQMTSIFHFFKQPYPMAATLNRSLWTNFLIGCFVAFFLIVFQPFEIGIWKTDLKWLKLLGYGLVAFVMPSLLLFFRQIFFKNNATEDHWKVGDELMWLFLTLIIIAIGNMAYSYQLGILTFSFNNFVISLLFVAAIGIFPIMANIIFKYNKYNTQNVAKAKIIDHAFHVYQENIDISKKISSNIISFLAENEKDTIIVKEASLIYLESADNYSIIVHEMDGKLQKEMLRGSLKRFESQITNEDIQRCHRSFIVNLRYVDHITGNAQGYRISLKGHEMVIPVSRNYGPSILEYLVKIGQKN